LQEASDCRLVQVGSGLVYGHTANLGAPLTETAMLAPIDDYAASKAAADLALGAYARKGLKCIRLRPFNHTGPGQTDSFAIPAFAMQIARIEACMAAPVVRVGNLETERDILDVADIADAYALAVTDGAAAEPDAVFNVASGAAYRMKDILSQLLSLSTARITIEHDPLRGRPSELPRMVGDACKFRARFGWAPKYTLGETLARVLEDCRLRVLSSKERP
jgi:GDP-4-dehydro-6-deoxy-D-mannose reductase